MPKADMHGALFFSKDDPNITGYLVIGGIEYEIAGWRASEIRSELKARRRQQVGVQLDILDDVEPRDGPVEAGS
jgi:hypothetical protein